MSEPTASPGPVQTSWRTVNIVLLVLAVLLAAAIAFFVWQGTRTEPAEAKAQKVSDQYTAVTNAAEKETVAFLTVDHRNMDPLIEKVLAGATGQFKQQYAGARENLKTSATKAEAVSSGKVRSVGVGDLTANSAVVFVAADSQVANKTTKGKAQPRYYRLKLTMVKQGDTWRTSDLEFVG